MRGPYLLSKATRPASTHLHPWAKVQFLHPQPYPNRLRSLSHRRQFSPTASTLIMDASDATKESSQFAALSSFAGSGNGKIEKVVQDFTQQTRSAGAGGTSKNVDESLNAEWRAIIAVAGETGYQSQDKLVEFVQTLKQETLKSQNGDAVKSSEGGNIWNNLPTFGWQMREAWNYTPKDPRTSEAAKARWVNQNAFAARLTSSSTSGSTEDPLNFSLYAIWSIREALEDDAPEETPGEGSVKAAAVWFIYSAGRLWELSNQGEVFEGRQAAPGRKFRDQEWRGFSKDRWSAWKAELKETRDASNGDTAELLKQALQKMESAETS